MAEARVVKYCIHSSVRLEMTNYFLMGVVKVTWPTFKPWHIALPPENDRSTATDNMYEKFGKIWTCDFWDMRTDRQTDMQTRKSQYFGLLPRTQ